VFVKPSGGWAGLLTESANLSASDVTPLAFFGDSVTVSGNTVVVGATNENVGANHNQGSAYVFVKPAGGWAGLLQENAKLTASDGAANDGFGRLLDASGDTVVVGAFISGGAIGGGGAYVFVEPPGGWAGALHENARLTGSVGVSGMVAVAASGDTVVDVRNVYFKPAGGWAGVLTENARLTRSDGLPAIFPAVDVDGNTVVAGFCGGGTPQEAACVFEGLGGAEPAATRIDCKTVGCKIPITCNLAQNCTNRITLLVRARNSRLREETRAKAPRMILFAAAVANIPPGVTKPVKLKLTKAGRDIVKNNKKRRLQGVIEIRNAPGAAFDTTPLTIRLR
jgi:hypothetical protein